VIPSAGLRIELPMLQLVLRSSTVFCSRFLVFVASPVAGLVLGSIEGSEFF
jgi:hypothetical protein